MCGRKSQLSILAADGVFGASSWLPKVARVAVNTPFSWEPSWALGQTYTTGELAQTTGELAQTTGELAQIIGKLALLILLLLK